MKPSAIMLAMLMMLAGCTSVATVPTPDGGHGTRIACNQLSNCYERASEVCHGGKWRIIDSTAVSKPTPQIIIQCRIKGDVAN